MRKTTAVSYEGDRYEISALNQLAKEKGVSAGSLVASAVREKYERELAPIISFFRKRDLQKSQLPSVEGEHA